MSTETKKEGTAAEAAKKAARTAEKADNFKRLAPARVAEALTAIERVERLCVRTGYEYTAEEAAKVVSALRAAVDSAERSYAAGKLVKGGGFTL